MKIVWSVYEIRAGQVLIRNLKKKLTKYIPLY